MSNNNNNNINNIKNKKKTITEEVIIKTSIGRRIGRGFGIILGVLSLWGIFIGAFGGSVSFTAIAMIFMIISAVLVYRGRTVKKVVVVETTKVEDEPELRDLLN